MLPNNKENEVAKLIQVNELHWVDPSKIFHVHVIGIHHVVVSFGDAKDNRRIDMDCGSADAAKAKCAEIASAVNIACMSSIPFFPSAYPLLTGGEGQPGPLPDRPIVTCAATDSSVASNKGKASK